VLVNDVEEPDVALGVVGVDAGSRKPVRLAIEQVLADFPYLERADVLAALEYAAAISQEREVSLARPA